MEPADVNTPGDPCGESNASSLRRALELLWAFRGVQVDLGLTELAGRANIPKSTAFRLLRDLEASGFVDRSGTKYRLGLSLFELGSRVDIARPRGLRNSAIHAMTVLHAESGLTLHLGVLKDSEVVILDKLHGPRNLRINTTPGQRLPANRTALGKVLLAFSGDDDAPGGGARYLRELDDIRRTRIAYNREELMAGVVCVAAPIATNGEAVAALSASVTSPNIDLGRLETLLLETSSEIARLHHLNSLGSG